VDAGLRGGGWRGHGWPVVVLLVVAVVLVATRDGAPSPRDDEVFLQTAYLVRTEGVSVIEGVTRAAGHQYGWHGAIADRLRSEGDIQTYALIPLWARIGGFEVAPSPWGRELYVTSGRLSILSQLGFLLSMALLYWALLPLGRGVALAAAVLYGLGHPFRHGPALFDPWVMPAVTASIGAFLRDRHLLAAALAVGAVLVKPNYLFLLPAFLLAARVVPGPDEPDATVGWRPAGIHLGATLGVIGAYLVLGWLDVIHLGGYAEGVRSGYDPGVLAYSLVETVSYTYRAGTQQLRTSWPLFPWTLLNAGALVLLGVRTWKRRLLPRTGVLLAGLFVIPIVMNVAVIASIEAYEDGGHYRWINVAVIGTVIALVLGYREAWRWWRARDATAAA